MNHQIVTRAARILHTFHTQPQTSSGPKDFNTLNQPRHPRRRIIVGKWYWFVRNIAVIKVSMHLTSLVEFFQA